MMDRMKCVVVKASEGAWYKKGMILWLSKRTFNAETGTYNLKYCNQDRTVNKADIFIIPWPFRKLFHGINCHLPPLPYIAPETPEGETIDGVRVEIMNDGSDSDDYDEDGFEKEDEDD